MTRWNPFCSMTDVEEQLEQTFPGTSPSRISASMVEETERRLGMPVPPDLRTHYLHNLPGRLAQSLGRESSIEFEDQSLLRLPDLSLLNATHGFIPQIQGLTLAGTRFGDEVIYELDPAHTGRILVTDHEDEEPIKVLAASLAGWLSRLLAFGVEYAVVPGELDEIPRDECLAFLNEYQALNPSSKTVAWLIRRIGETHGDA